MTVLRYYVQFCEAKAHTARHIHSSCVVHTDAVGFGVADSGLFEAARVCVALAQRDLLGWAVYA